MDIIEKQQKIESINGIIWARWFIALIITGLGFVLKTGYFSKSGASWGIGWGTDLVTAYIKIGVLGGIAFIYNFIFWLIMYRINRQKIENVNPRTLNIMATLQIIPDQLAFTVLYYFNGSVDTMAFVFYFLSLFFAGAVYKTKGIILTGILIGFLHTMVLMVEYMGLLPHLRTYEEVTFFGYPYILKGKVFSFISYIGITTFVSAFLSNLIRNREQRLRGQHTKLSEQAHTLTLQTQQLTQAKGQLESALSRSDIARKAATQSRDETEEANIQLKNKIDELEKFYNVTVGREVRMVELKSEIKELKQTIKKLEDQLPKK